MRAYSLAWLFAAIVGLLACSATQAQTVAMPATVEVPAGRAVATVTIEYDGDDLSYDVPAELESIREFTDKPKTIVLKIIGYKAGKYTVLAVTVKDKKLSPFTKCVVSFGGIVPPEPTPPVPPVPPKPIDPPTPVGELRVLFVYESQEALSRTQILTLNSTAVRKWLGEKCVKESGQAGYRYWDKDVDTSKEQQSWKDLWSATKSTLKTAKPQVVVFRGMSGKAFDLPENEDDLLKLLKKEGE